MSASLLEQARSSYENTEAYERTIGKQLDTKPKTNKQRVWQQHHIKNLIKHIQVQSKVVVAIHQDADETFKDELESMKGRNAFGSFYESLRETKEYHQRNPYLMPQNELNMDAEMECKAQFSGPELFGKYLDLVPFHARATNMKKHFGPEPVEYSQFLLDFHEFSKVPAELKRAASYVSYTKDLCAYLMAFMARTQPLVSLEEMATEADEVFEKAWKDTEAEKVETENKASNHQEGRLLDLAKFHSAKEIEALGLARLKDGCLALGLKCGGGAGERAERLWRTKGLTPDQYPSKILASRKRKRDGKSDDKEASDSRHDVARAEFRISFLCDQMADVLDATRRYVDKKQTQLVEERDAEFAEEESGALAALDDEEDNEAMEEEDEGPLYNPLNLPLGWDGKPIPYWLYKLHGLGVEYKCEICGNMSYWGRRAFDRHFQEWRHAYGMRCLKIPNTKHFHDITLIEDATNLYDKIKDQLKQEQFDANQEEEFEDSEGHVLNRRTFEDLARQGLL